MKKVYSLIAILVISLFFTGCVSSKISTVYYDPNRKAELKINNIPELNIISTSEVGSSMYEKINRYEPNTFNIRTLEPIPKMFSMATGKFGVNKPIELGLLKTDKKTNWKAGCTSKGYYHDNEVCLYDIDNDSKFDKAGATINNLYTDLEKKVSYEIYKSNPIYKQDSFRYVALYQGKKANTIKISFREFKDNMARPAFTQDIEYELDANGKTTIGFKGLRIDVLKATNFDITYKVIKDYN